MKKIIAIGLLLLLASVRAQEDVEREERGAVPEPPAVGPLVVGASFSQHKETLLGVELERTRFKVEFDRDLYIPEHISCNAGCKALPECLPCDYGSESCGQEWTPRTPAEVELRASLPASCRCDGSDADQERLCASAPSSRALVLGGGETEVRSIRRSEVHAYRFYHADPCNGFIVKLKTFGGNVKLLLSRTPDINDAFLFSSFIELLEDADQLRVCPLEEDFQVGTYYLFARPQEVSRYSLELEAVVSVEPREPTPVDEQLIPCPLAAFGVQCLEDGVPFRVQGNGFAFVPAAYFSFFECQQLEVWTEILGSPPAGFNAEARLHMLDRLDFLSAEVPLPVTNGQNRVVNVCPQAPLPDGTPQPGMILTFALFVITAPVDWEFQFTFRTTTPERLRLYPVAELEVQRAWKLAGTVQLACPFVELPPIEGDSTNLVCQPIQRCTRWWPSVSTDDFDHALLPVPLELKARDPGFAGIQLPDAATASRTHGSRINFGTINSIAQSGPTDVYLSRASMLNCRLQIFPMTTLVDADNRAVPPQIIDFSQSEEVLECVAADFALHVNASDELASALIDNNLVTPGGAPLLGADELQTSRFHVDAIAFSSAWEACVDMMRSFYVDANATNIEVVSDVCLNAYDAQSDRFVPPNDACCNATLKWETCCSERLTQVGTPSGGRVDQARIEAQCGSGAGAGANSSSSAATDCIGELVQEFADRQRSLDSGVCKQIVPGQLSKQLFANMRFYRQCRVAAFGDDDLEGVRCLVDVDCTQRYGSTSSCDATRGRCVNAREVMEQLFLECLAASMSPFARNVLARRHSLGTEGEAVADSLIVGALRAEAGTQACVSETGPGSPARAHFNSVRGGNFCGPCDTYCLDTTCARPLPCLDRGPCGRRDWASFRDKEAFDQQQCEDFARVCNHDKSLLTEEECVGDARAPNLCMVCTTASQCSPVEGFVGGERECLAASVCVRPDGTARLIGPDEDPGECSGAAQAQCGSGATHSPVPIDLAGEPAAAAAQCAAAGGECEERQRIADILIDYSFRFGTLWPFTREQVLEGVCIEPLQPEGSPTCTAARNNALSSQDFSTQRGCVVFIDCFATIEASFCEPYLFSQAECEAAGGTWYLPVQDSRAQCEGEPLCDEGNPSGYWSVKSEQQCLACGGLPKRAGTWHEGALRRGRTLVGGARWVRKRWVPLYQWAPSLDFSTLQILFEDIIAQQLAFAYRAELQCDKTVTKQLVSVVAAQCSAGDDDAEQAVDADEVGSGAVVLGSAMPCAGERSVMDTPPLRIEFSEGSIGAGCVIVEATLAYATELQTTREESKTALFVDTEERRRLYHAVRNDNDELVGQVLGDGVTLSAIGSDGSDATGEQNVLLFERICITIDTSIEIDAAYTRFDLGRRTSQKTVRALGIDRLQLTNAGNTLCTVQPLREPFDRASTYFAVVTRQDYDDYDGEESLSGGEEALFYVVASIYVLTLLLSLSVLVAGIVKTRPLSGFLKNGLLLTLFALLTLLRAIYFYLAADEILGVDENAADYVLLELPTFLYLAACSLVMLSFIFVVLSKGGERQIATRNYWISFAIIAALLTVLFIVVVVLLETLPGEDETSVSCFGRIVTVDEDDTASIIRISYKSLLTAIAVVIAVVIVWFGVIIWNKLQMHTVIFVAFTVAFGVAANGIAFIVYLAVDEPTPYFAIVILATEAIPIAIVSFLIIPRDVRERMLTTIGAGTASGSGSTSRSGFM